MTDILSRPTPVPPRSTCRICGCELFTALEEKGVCLTCQEEDETDPMMALGDGEFEGGGEGG